MTANNTDKDFPDGLGRDSAGRFRQCAGRVAFLVSVVCLLAVAPAFGIRLVTVRHLFDIQHHFNSPSDVSAAPDGRIYVVDGVNHQVKVFDREGGHLFSFGGRGLGDGRFESPLGIHIDGAGKVYIADSGNHRVQVFQPDGTFSKKIVMPADTDHAADPTDLVVDRGGARCYVVDNDNHRIRVFDLKTGSQVDVFGQAGDGKREFRYPFLIDIGREDDLYIVDVINTRVQVLNPEGLFVTYVGGWGVEKGEFFRPKGVAVGKDERVYVSDSYLGVIQVFEPNGEFYAVVGGMTPAATKKFRTPVGLFIDDGNRLYVTEMLANKVSVYQIEGATGQN